MEKLPPVEKIPEAGSAIAEGRVFTGESEAEVRSSGEKTSSQPREEHHMRREPKSIFYQNIYALVGKIPAGAVATYGQIAMLAGSPRAARQVGYAMSAVSAERRLPCHRVVNRLGELAPEHAFGDRGYQRMLLESEGVAFLPDGRIDLEKHLWSGPEQEASKCGTPTACVE